MAREWTDEQLKAIQTRDRSLLVSAAAGSGKTATLTERIIRSVLDESAPIDLSDMLVVTFTNAAASELREKITAALKEAIKNNPSDQRLEKQLLMMKLILEYYDKASEVLEKGGDIEIIASLAVREQIGRFKYLPEAETQAAFDEILHNLDVQIEQATVKED